MSSWDGSRRHLTPKNQMFICSLQIFVNACQAPVACDALLQILELVGEPDRHGPCLDGAYMLVKELVI